MNQHTKGEWALTGDKAPNCGNIDIGSLCEHRFIPIARINKDWENVEANAHLIAKSPQMARLLQRLIKDGYSASIIKEAGEIIETLRRHLIKEGKEEWK